MLSKRQHYAKFIARQRTADASKRSKRSMQPPPNPEVRCFARVLETNEFNVDLDPDLFEKKIRPRLTPEISVAIKRAQCDGVSRMVRARRCINGAGMGTGKTIQGVACIVYFNDKPGLDAVICPAYLCNNWKREFETWNPERPVNVIKTGADIAFDETAVTVVSYDMAAKYFAERPDARLRTVVCDEAHYLKTRTSKRFVGLAPVLKNAEQLFLLTGTPLHNLTRDLYAQFHLVRPEYFKSYYAFADRYCDRRMDVHGHFDDRGSSNVSELAAIKNHLIIRIRAEDMEDNVQPKVTRKKVPLVVAVPGKFAALRKKYMDTIGSMDTDRRAVQKVQQMASEMFHMTAEIKRAPVVKYLRESLTEERTVIFCTHQSMYKAINELMAEMEADRGLQPGEGYVSISGETAMKKRPEAIKRFLDPGSPCRYAVLTTGSCSTGLNIIPIRRMIFTELEWCPATLDQCECRIRRIGGAKDLLYEYLLCDGTLDGYVFDKIMRKSDLARRIVDNGKDYGDMSFKTKKSKYF